MPLTDAAAVQLIAVIGSIVVAVVTAIGIVIVAMLNRTRQHARAASKNTAETRDEVKNSHEINLRDNIDTNQAGILDALKQIRDDVMETRVDIREIRGTVHDDREENRRRFAEFERTRPTPVPRKRPTKGATP